MFEPVKVNQDCKHNRIGRKFITAMIAMSMAGCALTLPRQTWQDVAVIAAYLMAVTTLAWKYIDVEGSVDMTELVNRPKESSKMGFK